MEQRGHSEPHARSHLQGCLRSEAPPDRQKSAVECARPLVAEDLHGSIAKSVVDWAVGGAAAAVMIMVMCPRQGVKVQTRGGARSDLLF